jgi:periplasmic protein CpxP/Spy
MARAGTAADNRVQRIRSQREPPRPNPTKGQDMRRYDGFLRIAAATAVALTMSLGVGVASAQPASGAQRPPMHGPGMNGGGDEIVGHVIARAKAQLNLNTMQQGMFDTAVANSKAVHEKMRAAHQSVRAALEAELARPDPDLAAVAKAADSARQAAQNDRLAVRDQWLALYATFTTDQKAVVKTMLQNHIARADSFRERMHERFQQFHNKSGTAGS